MERKTASRPSNAGRQGRSTTVLCTLIAICFCAFLFVFQVLYLLTPDKKASENENRMLQQHPSFSFSALFDGSYMKNYETYLTDQFPNRDRYISFKSRLSEWTGVRIQQNTIRAKSGRLLEQQTPVDDALLESNAEAITRFAEDFPALNTAVLIAPNATCFFRDELPYGFRQENQTDILNAFHDLLTDRLVWVDAVSALQAHDKDALFYRTDHHWTTRAAFDCFLALNAQWKLGAKEKHFEFYPVSDSFSGTLASAYGDRKLKDTIEVCVPKKSGGTYTVDYESQQKKTVTLFDELKLDQKNQYEVFLGGNFDKIIISMLNDSERTLLLFKDSYANCLIPMLTPYFSKIVVIDPRYFSGSLSDVLGETDFTHVLFLYNLNTFLADKSLAPVLRTANDVTAAQIQQSEETQNEPVQD